VSFAHLASDEYRAVEHALEVLDGEIVAEPGTRAAKLWPRIRTVLAAADDLLLATARGERAPSEDEGRVRRPRVVLPLVRSS
jgi:hypothetical protein